MDIRKLTYFEAVCRNLSYTKASEELHVSQPSVSVAVRSLEKDLGVRLISQYQGRLSITPEGKFLFQKATEVLKALDNIDQEMQAFLEKRGNTIRIGYSEQMRQSLCPILKKFEKDYPETHVVKNESSTTSIEAQIQSGSIDFGVIAVSKELMKRLEVYPLFQGELKVCVSKSNPLSRKDSLTIEEFEAQPLVSHSFNEPKDSYIFQILRDAWPERDIMIEPTCSYFALPSYFRQIQSGEGIGLTYYDRWFSPDRFDGNGEDFSCVQLPFRPKCTYTVAVVYLKNRRLKKFEQTFLNFVKMHID